MTGTILERQAELPRFIPLYRYAPTRVQFSWHDWNPEAARSAEDLPQYLILGNLDPSSFNKSEDGWSARWQGTEDSTYFEVLYNADERRWEVRQKWRGIDGGSSFYSSQVPLNKVIGQALYMQFPSNWDSTAKTQLEAEYQITVVEQPEGASTFCGIPDGAFRTIVFPIAVRNFRSIQQWLQDSIERSPLPYPITAEARLVFQALNYLEGKALEWTKQKAVVFNHSVEETGLIPYGFPSRETANDGSAAWTLRREIYFMFIGLPFAGLTDFLDRMSTDNGPIRTASDPDLRFELRPVVIPAGFEIQTESIAIWDQARTTRSFLKFSLDESEMAAPDVENIIDNEKSSAVTLAQAEAISAEVLAAIEQVLKQANSGRAS
jgi:hypothetical protein